MERKEFIQKTLLAALGLTIGSSLLHSCAKEGDLQINTNNTKINNTRESGIMTYLLVSSSKKVEDAQLAAKFNCNTVLEVELIKTIVVRPRTSKNQKLDLPYYSHKRLTSKRFRNTMTTAKDLYTINDYQGKLVKIKVPVMANGKPPLSLNCEIVHTKSLDAVMPKNSEKAYNQLKTTNFS